MRFFALFLVFCAGTSFAQAPAKKSGYEGMGPELRAMQDDDFANPGMLSVLDGEALWKAKEGSAGKACADCHAAGSMKGVAARYPALDASRKRLFDLEGRINACRTEKQGAKPWAYESKELLAITAYVANQSKGMPIAVTAVAPAIENGKKIYFQRQGQLNLSCAQCHDERAGGRLGGAPIPQAHPTGYPVYRLEWQGMGSLQRRLRNCIGGMRAEPYPYGAQELVELELYLMSRAAGMKLETPAVRP